MVDSRRDAFLTVLLNFCLESPSTTAKGCLTLMAKLLRFEGFWTRHVKVNPFLEAPVEVRDEWTFLSQLFSAQADQARL